jgi:integrase
VFSARDQRKIRRTFRSYAEARSWRADAQRQVELGALRVHRRVTVRQAADRWIRGARQGSIRNRSGDRYKPSALRGYEQALRQYVLPALGGCQVAAVRRGDLQRLIGHLQRAGLSPSTIRNALLPVRAIYRHAIDHDLVVVNPTVGLSLPAVRGKRDRIVGPDEAARLLDALWPNDRALWATALYAGLRLGELRALHWDDLDLAAGLIRVERSWDAREGMMEPKSRAGRRTVPVAAVLRDHLVEHRMRVGRSGLVFGRSAERPFNPSSVTGRARTAWQRAGLEPITPHEARHTFASLMIAAGVNAKALSTFMGHSSITITLDRYGHLMPGSESEAAALLDAYIERASTAVRLAAVE